MSRTRCWTGKVQSVAVHTAKSMFALEQGRATRTFSGPGIQVAGLLLPTDFVLCPVMKSLLFYVF